MKTSSNQLVRRLRPRLLVALLGALVGTAACDDPFQITASTPNIDQSFEIWAMTGSPAAYPAGILVPQAAAVRLDAAGSFDLAFDIDADGRLLVYPVGTVVSPIEGTRDVEFQRGVGTYNAIVEAPRTGWTKDSVLTVNEGQAFLVKVTTLFCRNSFQQQVYAKFIVDSVVTADRRIKLSGRVNPNCGFRSLLSGIPGF